MIPILMIVHEIQMLTYFIHRELADHIEIGNQRNQFQLLLQEPLLFFDAPDLKIVQELNEEAPADPIPSR